MEEDDHLTCRLTAIRGVSQTVTSHKHVHYCTLSLINAFKLEMGLGFQIKNIDI